MIKCKPVCVSAGLVVGTPKVLTAPTTEEDLHAYIETVPLDVDGGDGGGIPPYPRSSRSGGNETGFVHPATGLPTYYQGYSVRVRWVHPTWRDIHTFIVYIPLTCDLERVLATMKMHTTIVFRFNGLSGSGAPQNPVAVVSSRASCLRTINESMVSQLANETRDESRVLLQHALRRVHDDAYEAMRQTAYPVFPTTGRWAYELCTRYRHDGIVLPLIPIPLSWMRGRLDPVKQGRMTTADSIPAVVSHRRKMGAPPTGFKPGVTAVYRGLIEPLVSGTPMSRNLTVRRWRQWMFYAVVMYTTRTVIQQATSGAGYGDPLVHHDGGRANRLVSRWLGLDETIIKRVDGNTVGNGALETRLVLSCVAYIWTHLVCMAPVLFPGVTDIHELDHGWLMSLVVSATDTITGVWNRRGGGREWWPEDAPGTCDACLSILCNTVIGVREPVGVVTYIARKKVPTMRPSDAVYASDQLLERIGLVSEMWFAVQDYGDVERLHLNPVTYMPEYEARVLEEGGVDTRPEPVTDGEQFVSGVMRSSRRAMNGWLL